jgi:hypothetical protein
MLPNSVVNKISHESGEAPRAHAFHVARSSFDEGRHDCGNIRIRYLVADIIT